LHKDTEAGLNHDRIEGGRFNIIYADPP